MVVSYGNLSFVGLESLLAGRKLKCEQCGKTSHSVVKCNMNCNHQSHVYCALKSHNSEQSKGWRALFNFAKGQKHKEIYDSQLKKFIYQKYKFRQKLNFAELAS